MTSTVKAVYEGGVLRPLEPLDLGEHEQVYVLLLPDEPAKIAAAQRVALEQLVGSGESSTVDMSVRHDESLYPRQ
ncbi:MAG TPA: antitoxin family protein [Candidatus Methylomirabilis sp.]|nr:antitoxin family protein [Candidatus Methylomirabilis sp.]